LQYKSEIEALEELFQTTKTKVDLEYLEVKQDFKLNSKQTIIQAGNEIIKNIRNTMLQNSGHQTARQVNSIRPENSGDLAFAP